MNRDDDFIAQLEDYLDVFEGATPLPDRVRDAIRGDLPGIRQVRPGRSPGRMLDMISSASTSARWVVAAVVVVATVALGAAFFGFGRGSAGVGTAPTASPAPTPSAVSSASPSAASSPPTTLAAAPTQACAPGGDPHGCMVPATYRLTSERWPAQITIDVPAGWFNWEATPLYDGVLIDSGPDAPNGSGWGVMFSLVDAVSKDPCDATKGTFDSTETSTVQRLVDDISRWPGFETTSTPTVVDGRAATLVEFTSSPALAKCQGAKLWTTSDGGAVDAYGLIAQSGNHKVQFRFVEVGGRIVAIRTTDFPEPSPNEIEQGVAQDPNRHAADQVELRQIVDSIKVTAATP